MHESPRSGILSVVNMNRMSYAVFILLCLAAFAGGYWWNNRASAMPDLDRPFTPREDLPQSIQDEARAKVASATAELKNQPDLISRWLQLAVYRKGANDFAGAEEIWLYVTKQWPEDAVAYGNLADLYQSSLNDYPKAEEYWKKTIALRPSDSDAYRNLADLYRLKLSTPEKATELLLRGVAANPDRVDLLIPLARLEAEMGDAAAARGHYDTAIKLAEAQNNASLSVALKKEMQELR